MLCSCAERKNNERLHFSVWETWEACEAYLKLSHYVRPISKTNKCKESWSILDRAGTKNESDYLQSMTNLFQFYSIEVNMHDRRYWCLNNACLDIWTVLIITRNIKNWQIMFKNLLKDNFFNQKTSFKWNQVVFKSHIQIR